MKLLLVILALTLTACDHFIGGGPTGPHLTRLPACMSGPNARIDTLAVTVNQFGDTIALALRCAP